jgi:small subunit ribosomal protein S4
MPSCPVTKRSYAPGQQGAKRRVRRGSDYSHQLAEKQKARAIYGIGEKRMLLYYEEARKTRSATAEQLISLLERRLDNVVYRCGWAVSRDMARQLVTHRKVKVNGKKVWSPSYLIKIGDMVSFPQPVDSKSKNDLPKWLEISKSATEAKIKALPTKEDANLLFNEQLIIEFYSR